MDSNELPKLGLSIVSLFPASEFPLVGPKIAQSILEEAQLDFFQMLPLWTYRDEDYLKFPKDRVLTFEGAWNKGTMLGVLKRNFNNRILHKLDIENPTLADVLLFGSHPEKAYAAMIRAFPRAALIVHSFDATDQMLEGWNRTDPNVRAFDVTREILVELNPSWGAHPAFLGTRTAKLVLDSRHLFYPGYRNEPPLFGSYNDMTYWLTPLVNTGQVSVAAVHIKEENDPLAMFMIRDYHPKLVVLELRPLFALTRREVVKKLQEMRQQIFKSYEG